METNEQAAYLARNFVMNGKLADKLEEHAQQLRFRMQSDRMRLMPAFAGTAPWVTVYPIIGATWIVYRQVSDGDWAPVGEYSASFVTGLLELDAEPIFMGGTAIGVVSRGFLWRTDCRLVDELNPANENEEAVGAGNATDLFGRMQTGG